MKAAVWHARNDIRVETVPDPGPPGPGEVVIRVGACGSGKARISAPVEA